MIQERLAGKRIGVTGATGFLGTALVERLLRTIPDCEVAAVVRPGRRMSATERASREILRNDCFDRLRSERGDRFRPEIEDRLLVVSGDVAVEGLALEDEGRDLLAGCEIVIHSAAAVSFDSPLDVAVDVNLLGPSRVASVLGEQLVASSSGGRKTAKRRSPKHLIAVSTAYVAGARRGDALERTLPQTPYATEADWRAEVEAASRARGDLDAESRRPARLRAFSRAARTELGAAGVPLLAERAERKRRDWVRDQLVLAGRARAKALGWPDAYAYSKALGERALLDTRGELPVTILRPSIIESALEEPAPGWIRGFRMAEPVIISYARGLLSQFPGIPEGVIDVIPVDLVVGALIAIAARGPAPDGPSVYQVASGAINPLRYAALVDLCREWFLANPLTDSHGQPIVVPDLSFPGRGRVQRQLSRATQALSGAERVLSSLPIRGRRAEISSRLEERRTQAERALNYVELYGSYTESEARFRVDRLMEFWESLDQVDRRLFSFDPRTVDWTHYLHDVHLPSVVVHGRVRSGTGRSPTLTREERGLRAVLAPERHLAAFDLENTLIASNVVESYAWLATRHLGTANRALLTARLLREAPFLLSLDRRDRGDFLRSFYRHYEDAPAGVLESDSWEMFSDLILAKSFPAGIRRVREHRKAGHRTLLITGALDFIVEPLRPLFDGIVCASLSESSGALSGHLEESPPTGEARALLIASFCEEEGLALEQTVAYADSTSDLPMLEAVGHPVAVNPEPKLATIARKRGWHVETWERARGARPALLPIGPRETT